VIVVQRKKKKKGCYFG